MMYIYNRNRRKKKGGGGLDTCKLLFSLALRLVVPLWPAHKKQRGSTKTNLNREELKAQGLVQTRELLDLPVPVI